jgi:hypothetical protein
VLFEVEDEGELEVRYEEEDSLGMAVLITGTLINRKYELYIQKKKMNK